VLWASTNHYNPCSKAQTWNCRKLQFYLLKTITRFLIRSCLDTRKYLHPETSEWRTRDPRCEWKYYRGKMACDVIERSEFKHIHFVGDSFVRNMFVTLLMLLSDDTEREAWSQNMREDRMVYCRHERYVLNHECRDIIRDIRQLRYSEKLCDGHQPNFTVSAKISYSWKAGDDFINATRDLAGKPRNLVLLGMGIHMGLKADCVISQIIEPGLQARDKFYVNKTLSTSSKWPQIIYVIAMRSGILKPITHLVRQDDQKLWYFADKVSTYWKENDIPVLDFRSLTANVHSFDGSHYDIGVNLIKSDFSELSIIVTKFLIHSILIWQNT